MSLELVENLQRQNNHLVRRLARKNKLMEEMQTELAQKEVRIEQLENHIGAMEAFTSAGHSMDTFKKMRERIRELEELLKPINNTYQEIDDHVELRTGCAMCAEDKECDVLNSWTHILRVNLLALRKALSDKSNQSDKEDASGEK